jgi:hypothetical protein
MGELEARVEELTRELAQAKALRGYTRREMFDIACQTYEEEDPDFVDAAGQVLEKEVSADCECI